MCFYVFVWCVVKVGVGNMDLLVVFGISVGYGFSVYFWLIVLFGYMLYFYFEVFIVVIVLIFFGKYLESCVKC